MIILNPQSIRSSQKRFCASIGAQGHNNAAVAAKLRTSGFTVGMWRNRFIRGGITGLGDEVRSGAPRRIGDHQVERGRTPHTGGSSTGSHALEQSRLGRTGLSQSTVSQIWRPFGLRPHLSETFQLANDPLLVGKVRAIVGLYMNRLITPSLLSVDEQSQIQALSQSQPILPMLPDKSNVEPTTTNAMAPPVCSLPWASLPDRSSSVGRAIAPLSFARSCSTSIVRFRQI
jgi:hypothetical protein